MLSRVRTKLRRIVPDQRHGAQVSSKTTIGLAGVEALLG
jgi:hypothetical protein